MRKWTGYRETGRKGPGKGGVGWEKGKEGREEGENRGGRRKWQEKREVYACLSIPPSLYTNVICKIWKIHVEN